MASGAPRRTPLSPRSPWLYRKRPKETHDQGRMHERGYGELWHERVPVAPKRLDLVAQRVSCDGHLSALLDWRRPIGNHTEPDP